MLSVHACWPLMLTLYRNICKSGWCISVDFDKQILMGALDVGAVVLVLSIAIMQIFGGYGCNGRSAPKLNERTDVD